MSLFISILQVILVPVASPLVIGIIRKMKAVMQNRHGANIWQPYRDLIKLFQKDEVITRDASWIFRCAPYLLFGISLVIATGIPVFASLSLFTWTQDFLVIIYLFALSAFFLALAGLDTASPFGGFGSSREMTVAALAEGGLILSLLASALLAHNRFVPGIAHTIAQLPLSLTLAPLGIAFVAFGIALLAETKRYPFDNPATHLELTMIHEAMILEYSGRRLALMEWAAANKLFVFLTLAINCFIPWGILTADISILALGGAVAAFGLKLVILAASIALLESSIAKIRFFRIPDLLYTSFFLGTVAIVITIIQLQ